MRPKTYIKKGVWHLGKGKKQKGRFLPLIGSLAKPLFISAAGALAVRVLNFTTKKIFSRRKRRKNRRRNRIRRRLRYA